MSKHLISISISVFQVCLSAFLAYFVEETELKILCLVVQVGDQSDDSGDEEGEEGGDWSLMGAALEKELE